MCRAAGFKMNSYSALLRMRRRRNRGTDSAPTDALTSFRRTVARAAAKQHAAAPGAGLRPSPAADQARALTIRPPGGGAGAQRAIFGHMPYSQFDPERRAAQDRRLRQIPVRTLVPNVITLLALCAGLTGIRLALEGRYELALGAIVFAAMLDAVDGRVARMIKGTSRFGAELDSLADFFNFGVAPGLILYFWGLNALGNLGWIAAMVFAICAALRLARFNVQIEDPNRPAWAGNFFTGVPAPAGAIVVLLPIYLFFLQVSVPAVVTLIYTLAIAGLMVSRLPVLSGKKIGTRVPPEMVPPVILVVVLFIALLVSYPWHAAQRRHAGLSRLPAARLVLVSALLAGGCGRQRAATAAPAASDGRGCRRRPHSPTTNARRGSTDAACRPRPRLGAKATRAPHRQRDAQARSAPRAERAF